MTKDNKLKNELNDIVCKLTNILITTKVNKVYIRKSFNTKLIIETKSITLDELNDIINYTEKILSKYPVSFSSIKALNDNILIIFSIYTDAIKYLTNYFYDIEIMHDEDIKRTIIKLYTNEIKEINKLNRTLNIFSELNMSYISISTHNERIKVTVFITKK